MLTSKDYKKLSMLHFLCGALVLLILFFIIFIFDSLRIWHRPWIYEDNRFFSHMRLQAAGLIRNYDYDSFIIGNSRMENTSAAEASSLFGGKFINISISGASLFETNILSNYFFNKKKTKTVISTIEPCTERRGHGNYSTKYYEMLYDNNPLNDILIYININEIKQAFNFLYKKSSVGRLCEIESFTRWDNAEYYYSRFGGIDKWILHSNIDQVSSILNKDLPYYATVKISEQQELPVNIKEAINNNIEEFVVVPAKKYPDVRFMLIDPPLSTLQSAITIRDGMRFSIYKYWISQCVQKTSKLANVSIYGFLDQNFTDDITFYNDPSHYSGDINSKMLQLMTKNEYILTKNNIDVYLETVENKARAYDLVKLNDYVQHKLAAQKTSITINGKPDGVL